MSVLFVPLVLLVAAAGLLLTSVLTGQLAWAWASVAVSAVAAVVLVVRWWRHGGAGRHRVAEPAGGVAPETGPAAPEAAAAPEVQQEPGEEDTDAADLLVVCELSDEVQVIDEHPRYHLGTCSWVTSRPAEPLPVREARDAGFTPCARCGPDAVLAGRHRATSDG